MMRGSRPDLHYVSRIKNLFIGKRLAVRHSLQTNNGIFRLCARMGLGLENRLEIAAAFLGVAIKSTLHIDVGFIAKRRCRKRIFDVSTPRSFKARINTADGDFHEQRSRTTRSTVAGQAGAATNAARPHETANSMSKTVWIPLLR
jgi:hypothetical protein